MLAPAGKVEVLVICVKCLFFSCVCLVCVVFVTVCGVDVCVSCDIAVGVGVKMPNSAKGLV